MSFTRDELICPTSAIQGRFLKVGKSVRAAPIRSRTTADGSSHNSGTTADGEEKRVTPGLMARDYVF
jgi:hypothetical protein